MLISPNPAIWFEFPVVDLPRATAFYEKAFDLKMTGEKMDGSELAFFPMEMNRSGAGGALMKTDGYAPSKQGTVVYFHVDSIEAALKAIAAAGGQTLIPRTSIGQYGFFAHFEDSEGNRVGLHEMPG